MRVFILLLVATCAVLSVKAGGEKQRQQQQLSQRPPQGLLQDQQQESPQEPPQGPEDQQESPQEQPQGPPEDQQESPQEPPQGPPEDQQEGPQQESEQGPFQGPPQRPLKGNQKGQRPGPLGPHSGPLGPRPGPHRPPPPLFNNFTTPQLNAIVNRMLREAGRLREKMGNRGMNGHCVIDHVRAMFVNYNATMKTVEENFASCVTDDMKALPEKAITEILSCLPTPSELEAKREEEKAAFDALLETLKLVDEEVSAMTDDVQKQIKICQIEWSDVYQFYMDKSEKIFTGLQKIESCLSTQRSAIQAEATKYLEELKTCAQ